MLINKPIDAEEFLSIVTANYTGFSTACPPLYPTAEKLPYIGFTRVGGAEATDVSSLHSVSVDVWAETDAQALECAAIVAGVIRALPFEATEMQVYEAGYSAPPYLNPDTQNPAFKRASFTANLHMKDEIKTV